MSIKLPSLLSYTRTINPSLGAFYAVVKEEDVLSLNRNKINITTVGLATTISNFTTSPEAELEKNSGKNIQTTQMAIIPEGCNYCVVEFSLNVSNKFLNPTSCNSLLFRKEINKFVLSYLKTDNINNLARAYLTNIITAKFLFRNLNLSSNVNVIVTDTETKEKYSFSSKSGFHSLSQFKDSEDIKNIERLTKQLSEALSGTTEMDDLGFKFQKVLNWKVTAYFEAAQNTEVYPSQEFIDGAKGKILSTVRVLDGKEEQAIYHSQKIGNAIRTIDTWYPNYKEEERQYALPVEPYGIDKTDQSVQRDKQSLYTYLQQIDDLNNKKPEDSISNYIIACLIRGGVFSGKSDKK